MNLSLKTKCGHTLVACLASCRHERLCATPSLHPNDTFLHSAEAMGLDVPRRTSLLAVTFFLNFRWMEVSSRTPSRAPLSLLGVNSFSINRIIMRKKKKPLQREEVAPRVVSRRVCRRFWRWRELQGRRGRCDPGGLSSTAPRLHPGGSALSAFSPARGSRPRARGLWDTENAMLVPGQGQSS